MRHLSRTAILALLAGSTALAGIAAASAQEALRIGATFLVGGLDPTKGSAGWALASHGVGEKLFMVDRDGKLVPELAASAERTGELTWTVKLAEGRFFSDGTPATAAALKKGFDNTFANSRPAASTGGVLKFEAADELTLNVTTERPVPLIAALFAEWPLVAYTVKDDGSFLYTGPYAIKELKVDQQLDLMPNPHFAGADARSPIVLRRFGDAQTMALAFEAGELDLAFGLPTEGLSRLKANPDLTVKGFPVGYQYFGFVNTQRPATSDVKVRQAIDLAIDRAELVAALNAGEVATGAFAPYFPFAPKEPRTTDLAKAAALLDEAGWKPGADGIREKDGAKLSLLIVTYPQRPDLVTMMPVVKAALARVGIASDTRVVENINDYASGGDFDLALWAQHTAPSGDPAFFFNSMLKTGGALNFSRYASADFDAIVEGFTTAGTLEQRAEIALEAQAKLAQDVPATFLVSPEWFVGTSKRLANYEPWGSDYHVIRPDMGETR
jgi:peptide/nickel transport system substrate-binding protein